MIRRLAWILTLPLGLIIVSFAATNRQWVDVALWPLPFESRAPLYVLVLGAFVVGFIVGGALIWLRTAPRLWRARKDAQQVAKLEKTLSTQIKPVSGAQAALPATTKPLQLADSQR